MKYNYNEYLQHIMECISRINNNAAAGKKQFMASHTIQIEIEADDQTPEKYKQDEVRTLMTLADHAKSACYFPKRGTQNS
ncbi:hypothetical protein GMMP1_450065 [Candidatus Magnetomoraceae bacterium gMMP-1]